MQIIVALALAGGLLSACACLPSGGILPTTPYGQGGAAPDVGQPPTPEPPERGGGKANNGFGNGDQPAPGNSGSHNNAENDPGGRGDPRGGKKG